MKDTFPNGFSLIELGCVLSLIGILFSLAIPNLMHTIHEEKANQFVMHFYQILLYARSEAVKQGKYIILCPGKKKLAECGQNWKEGYKLLASDAFASKEDRGSLIRWYPPIEGRLKWNDGGVLKQLIFYPSGSAKNGTVVYCSPYKGVKVYGLVLSAFGRVRIAMADDLKNVNCAL